MLITIVDFIFLLYVACVWSWLMGHIATNEFYVVPNFYVTRKNSSCSLPIFATNRHANFLNTNYNIAFRLFVLW